MAWIERRVSAKCTTPGCPVRHRDGHASACRMHVDNIFDTRHAAQIDNARALLGERFNLVIPESAILAARLDDDDEGEVEVA
jgi:hypothetical protein